MNFIKTSKFSVKGIDTTRYILTSVVCKEESPIQSKGGTDPFRTYPGKDLKFFSGGVRGGSVHLLDLRRRPLTAFGVTHNGKGTSLPN